MYPGDLSVEATVPEDVQNGLVAKGHDLTVRPAWSLGAIGAILVNGATGVLDAGVDPRTEGYALAR